MSFLDDIKAHSMGRAIVVPIGVGSAFAKKNAQTSIVIAKDGVTILVDMGTTIPGALARLGINVWDFDYYHFTHSHADHIGGIEELLLMSRYVAKKKPKVIITEPYFKILWDDSVRGGCEHNEDGLLKFSDLMEPIKPAWMGVSPRERYEIEIEGINLTIFRTAHIPGMVDMWEKGFWSTGVMVDNSILYSGDTRFDLSLFEDLCADIMVDTILHDCQLFDPGIVHATYSELRTLPKDIRERMYLIHYGDSFEDIHPKADNFAGYAKPGLIY